MNCGCVIDPNGEEKERTVEQPLEIYVTDAGDGIYFVQVGGVQMQLNQDGSLYSLTVTSLHPAVEGWTRTRYVPEPADQVASEAA